MLTGTPVFPGVVMWFAIELSFLCESPYGGRRQQARWTGLLTQQQWVFEFFPLGGCDSMDHLCESTNHTRPLSLPYCLFHHFFSWCLKFRCAQIYLHRTASHLFFSLYVVNNTVSAFHRLYFIHQRMIKEKSSSVLFLSLYLLILFLCLIHSNKWNMDVVCITSFFLKGKLLNNCTLNQLNQESSLLSFDFLLSTWIIKQFQNGPCTISDVLIWVFLTFIWSVMYFNVRFKKLCITSLTQTIKWCWYLGWSWTC